jgi:hypothetical protein
VDEQALSPETYPHPLPRAYDPEQDVCLYSGPATLSGFAPGHTCVTFFRQPEPTLELACIIPVIDRQETKPALGRSHMSVPGHGRLTVQVHRVGSLSRDEHGNFAHEVDAMVVAHEQAAASLHALDFELYNFVGLFMPVAIQDDQAVWAGRLEVEERGWRLILDAPRPPWSTPERNRQRYKVSHLGRIERVDGQPFTVGDASDFTESVKLALSLAAGRYVAPCLSIGRDRVGEIVMADWQEPRVDIDVGQWPLISRSRTDDFVNLVQCVVRTRCDEYTREVTDHIVGYYLEANGHQMQIGLALSAAQSALMLLAWDQLVQHGTMPAKTFKHHASAAGLIRDLLAMGSIDKAIPKTLTQLETFAAAQTCQDGPDAITRLRNYVTHPHRQGGSLTQPMDTWVEAWQLSMNYLQLVILKRFGYNGHYLDRVLSRSEHDTYLVPWAIPEPATRPGS